MPRDVPLKSSEAWWHFPLNASSRNQARSIASLFLTSKCNYNIELQHHIATIPPPRWVSSSSFKSSRRSVQMPTKKAKSRTNLVGK